MEEFDENDENMSTHSPIPKVGIKSVKILKSKLKINIAVSLNIPF